MPWFRPAIALKVGADDCFSSLQFLNLLVALVLANRKVVVLYHSLPMGSVLFCCELLKVSLVNARILSTFVHLNLNHCGAIMMCIFSLNMERGLHPAASRPVQRGVLLQRRESDNRPRVLMIMGLAASLDAWKPQIHDIMSIPVRCS